MNHKDGDKTNNKLSNLEWSNPSDNQNHAVKMGLCSNEEEHYKSKLTIEQIMDILNDNRLHRIIAKDYRVNRSTITAIKARKTWKYVK